MFYFKLVKKLVSVFFAIGLLQGLPIAVEAQSMIDPIVRVLNAGFMSKDASGNFNAEGFVSRAELATILFQI